MNVNEVATGADGGGRGDAADADGDNGSGAPYFHPDFLGGGGEAGRSYGVTGTAKNH